MKINKKVMRAISAQKNTAWAIAFFYEAVQQNNFEDAMWAQFEYLLALDEEIDAWSQLKTKDWEDEIVLADAIRGYQAR